MRRQLLLAAIVAAMLHCDQADEDPEAALLELAGADATDCGYANGNDWQSELEPVEVRACVIEQLGPARSFRGAVSPPSCDGGFTVGWASDGTRLWRVDYSNVGGCSLATSDSLTETQCTEIIDRGADCGDLWDDLCLECVE